MAHGALRLRHEFLYSRMSAERFGVGLGVNEGCKQRWAYRDIAMPFSSTFSGCRWIGDRCPFVIPLDPDNVEMAPLCEPTGGSLPR